jgi:hypothetical protein
MYLILFKKSIVEKSRGKLTLMGIEKPINQVFYETTD